MLEFLSTFSQKFNLPKLNTLFFLHSLVPKFSAFAQNWQDLRGKTYLLKYA